MTQFEIGNLRFETEKTRLRLAATARQARDLKPKKTQPHAKDAKGTLERWAAKGMGKG